MKKTILITGCRSGFGLHTAIAAAREGHTVYAGLRDIQTSDDLIRLAKNLPVIPLQLDVTKPQEREYAMERILSERGRIDALVNNAGLALGGFLDQVEEDELRALFDVNVFGTWAMTKAVIPVMRKQGAGTIIMVSSMAGRMAFPGLGAYAGSKYALEGFSEAWRYELGLFGIRLIALEPGAYDTEIFGRNRNLCRHAHDPNYESTAMLKKIDKFFNAKIQKMAHDPKEVAQRIVELLDDPRPGFRYPMGPGAKERSLMIRLLPFSAIEKIMMTVLNHLK